MDKSTTCRLCDSPGKVHILDWRKYSICLCRNCGLLFSDPMPSERELQVYYQGFLFKKPEKKEIEKLTKRKKKELVRLFGFNPSVSEVEKNQFLDYGAGTGIAIHAARQLGLQCYYQDLDREALNFTRDTFGLSEEQIIEDIDKTNKTFDYIFSDNVIEHVVDPIAFVDRLMDKLHPGGTMVIKTPLARNFQIFFNPMILLRSYLLPAKKYNPAGRLIRAIYIRFWHCDPPRHLYSFSDRSLMHMCEQLKDRNFDYRIHHIQSYWLENTVTKEFFSKDKRASGLKSVLLRVVVLPYLFIELFLLGLKALLIGLRVLTPGMAVLTIRKRNS